MDTDAVIPTEFRPIGYWVKRLDDELTRSLDETLSREGLTRQEWQALNLLAQRPHSNDELLHVLHPFLVGAGGGAVIRSLLDQDLAEEHNGHLSLSAAGHAKLDGTMPLVSEYRRRVMNGIEPAQYQATVAVLEMMVRNLGRAGAETP
jgi:hypothetical protein